MKRRYILYRRKRGGMFYIEDTETRKQESTGTRNRAEATSLLNARNESIRAPQLNLQIAKAYLAGTDSGVSTRTWQQALDAIVETKSGSTKDRWQRAAKDKAFDLFRNRIILETQAEQLLGSLKAGTVSTNVHLRKLHNFCLSMNWLPWPLIPKRLWPEVKFQPKRAITMAEHQLILDREKNPERRSFYEVCWHLGGSQTDIANLKAEDIDWPNQTIAYNRQKTGSLAMVHFGDDIAAVLRRLPAEGSLFPYMQSVRCGDRATEFKQRCVGLGISGVSLHSYRYAWAERAKTCGYPERFAQEALGHNSKAVHRAYARRAQVRLPSLESYEKQNAEGRIIPLIPPLEKTERNVHSVSVA
jgi:integrase